MKSKLIIRTVAVLLVLSLTVSFVQPVSAASISGDVAPSGTDYLMNYFSNAAKLPDRTRYTFEIPQPEENYYSLSIASFSYDFTTSYVSIGGWTSSSSYTAYMYAYPVGRVFYRLPFSASLISSTDMRFEVTVQCRLATYYKDGSSTTYSSVVNSPYFEFRFYNADFQLVSSVQYGSSLSTSSGTASADSFCSRTYYSSSVVIPSEAVYVIPVVYFFRTVSKYSSQPSSWSYYEVSPIGMSCSMRFDVMNTESQIDGIWQFNDTLSYSSDVFQGIGFTSGGVSFTGMDYYPSDTGASSLWYNSDAGDIAYNDGIWYISSRKIVDFGSSGQTVSAEFYDFLTKNATRIGDSATDATEGSISIKDYSGSSVLAEHSLKFPLTVDVTETGLTFTSYTDPDVTWDYTYGGSGNFVGVSLVANAGYTRYKPGTSFVMTAPGSIYLHLEGDIDSGGSGTTDPTEPTDPVDPTDPTEPGGSSGDDLDGSGLDDSSGNISQGNDGLGDVVGNMNDAQGQLPELPENVGDQLGDNITDFTNSAILELMPWNDTEYLDFWNLLITPTLTTLSVSLLLYFVFGKANNSR